MQKKKLLALILIATLAAGEIPELPMMESVSLTVPRAFAESLEDKRDSYENQAEKKRKKMSEIFEEV